MWIGLLKFLLHYIFLSAVGYIVMEYHYRQGAIVALHNVKHRWLYYILQFTWGLPMNLVGCIVALVLVCCGKKAYLYGWNYCFELNINFGLELGIFFIAPPVITHTSAMFLLLFFTASHLLMLSE